MHFPKLTNSLTSAGLSLALTLAAGGHAADPQPCPAGNETWETTNTLGYTRTYCNACEDCPSNVHKHPTVSTDASSIPEGFVVYEEGGYRESDGTGLFMSDIHDWSPEKIPNTDEAFMFYISEDGTWIVFNKNGLKYKDAYAVKTDGSNLTQLTLPYDGTPYTFGLYRNSPTDNEEIFYTEKKDDPNGTDLKYWTIYAADIEFSSSGVTVGTEQRILYEGYAQLGMHEDRYLTVAKDRFFTQVDLPAGGTERSFVCGVIPDNGLGTADDDDTFIPDFESAKFQCGHSMSWDGEYCVNNPTTDDGDVEHCITRINVFKFTPPGHASSSLTSQLDFFSADVENGRGVAVVWEPRIGGQYVYSSFHYHRFTNNNEYILTRRHRPDGDASYDTTGIYMLHWPSATYTMLSPADVEASHVGAHFTNQTDAVKEHGTASGIAGSNTLFTIQGVTKDKISLSFHNAGMHTIDMFAADGSLLHRNNTRSFASGGIYSVSAPERNNVIFIRVSAKGIRSTHKCVIP